MWGGLGIGGEGRRVVGLAVNVLDRSRGLSWRTDSMYLVEQILGFFLEKGVELILLTS